MTQRVAHRKSDTVHECERKLRIYNDDLSLAEDEVNRLKDLIADEQARLRELTRI